MDRTYQLWLLRDGQATDKGMLGTGSTGGTMLVAGVRDEQQFAITREPAGGSPTPSEMPPPVHIQLT